MAVTITEQKYGPTTGTFTGWLGLVICGASIAALLADPTHANVRFALALAVVGVLIWCFVLRPRVIVREPDTLVLRNALSTWELPLAGVSQVRVRAITRVVIGETPYDGIGVGRRVRTMVRGSATRHGDAFPEFGRAPRSTPGTPPALQPRSSRANTPEAIADLVIEQVLAAAERARDAGHPTDQVRRAWAWPEIVVLVAAVLGFVGSFV